MTRPGFPPPVRRHSTPIPPLPHYGGRAPAPAPYVEPAPYEQGYDPRYDDPRYDVPRYDEPRYDEPRWDDEPQWDGSEHDGYQHDGYEYDEQYEDQEPYAEPYAPPRTNTMAVLGLVFAFLCSPLGLIFSVIGLRQVKRRWERGRGLAIAGLVVSVLMMAVAALFWVLVLPQIQEAAESVTSQAVAEELSDMTGTEISPIEGADAQAVAAACDVIMDSMLGVESQMATATTAEESAAVIAGVRSTLETAAAGTGDAAFITDVQALSGDFQQIADVAAAGGDTTELENKATVDSERVGARCAMAGWTE